MIIRIIGKCERCGKRDRLQCAHIISRTYMATRYDKENALSLCSGCHLWWHKEPILSARWLDKKYPDRFDRVNFKRQAITKVDLEIVYLMLQHDAKKLGIKNKKATYI